MKPTKAFDLLSVREILQVRHFTSIKSEKGGNVQKRQYAIKKIILFLFQRCWDINYKMRMTFKYRRVVNVSHIYTNLFILQNC